MANASERQTQRRLEVALDALDRAMNHSGTLELNDKREVEKAIKILEPIEARLWRNNKLKTSR